MAKLEALEQDGLRSELILKQRLKTLSETLRQQLQETETRQREELERRIHQNSLLSTDNDQQSRNDVKRQAKLVGMRRAASTSALSSHPGRSKSSSPAWKNYPAPTWTQQCEKSALSTTAQRSKEEEAECLKKFCARPVPSHVTQPLYQEMMELREKERKHCREQRRDFLLSIQRPFSFQEREKEKREKLMMAVFDQLVSHGHKNKTKPPHKEVKNSSDSGLKDCRQASTQNTARHPNPTVSVSPKLRTAERARKEKLDFLDERPSFQPKITEQVPDFSRIHRALQTELLRKTQSKEVVKCQPFNLRTSALPARRSRMSPEGSQAPKTSHISRSKSLGTLTSLSANTLPTYITDAVRKRCTAIRRSIELKEFQNQESAAWLESYQLRTQTMKKTVAVHAKLLDPLSGLSDAHNDKLQRHRKADRQRMSDYRRELRDMKARVGERPLLFQQVTQKTAKAHAEQTYRNKLQNAGVKEQFVEETGGTSTSSSENDVHSRNEYVDDGEKIEDVEEESVKSKAGETP